MADETVEIEVKTNADEAGGKFVSLRTQIRETTIALQAMADKGQAGTKEFKDLSNTLDKLQDQQKKVAFQSSQIEDKLSALPGPIGQIGRGFASAKSAVETFGVELAIATGGITLIIGAVIAMKEALSKTKEGQETLNKVSDAFGKILAPILALIEKVAIPIFSKFADGVAYVGEKFQEAAEYFGASKTKIKEIGDNISTTSKKFYDDAQADLDNMKKVLDMQKEAKEKAAQKEKERRDKERAKKEEEEKEAFEQEKRDLQYQLDEMAKIRKKFSKIDAKTVKADSLKTQTETAKALEEDKIARAKATEDEIRLLGINSIEKQTAWTKNHQTTALADEIKLKQDAAKTDVELRKITEEQKLEIVSNALGTIADAVGRDTVAGKALAVAQAGIDTYAGANKALATYPPPWGFIAAGTVIVAGLMNVQKILATKIPKVPGASSAPADNTSSIPVPSYSSPSFSAPQMGATASQNGTLASIVGQSLDQNNSQLRPIQAYVVGNQVTTQQQLDRRISAAARLGG
jgi:hypothetical protein